MNPAIALIINQLLNFGLELWRTHANKAADWRPTDADWDELQARAMAKTADDYKRGV
jgi:hypothetical protein